MLAGVPEAWPPRPVARPEMERRASFSDGAKSVFEDRSPLADIPAFRKDFRGKILGTWKLFSATGKENPVALCDPPEQLLRNTFPLGAQKRGNNSSTR